MNSFEVDVLRARLVEGCSLPRDEINNIISLLGAPCPTQDVPLRVLLGVVLFILLVKLCVSGLCCVERTRKNKRRAAALRRVDTSTGSVLAPTNRRTPDANTSANSESSTADDTSGLVERLRAYFTRDENNSSSREAMVNLTYDVLGDDVSEPAPKRLRPNVGVNPRPVLSMRPPTQDELSPSVLLPPREPTQPRELNDRPLSMVPRPPPNSPANMTSPDQMVDEGTVTIRTHKHMASSRSSASSEHEGATAITGGAPVKLPVTRSQVRNVRAQLKPVNARNENKDLPTNQTVDWTELPSGIVRQNDTKMPVYPPAQIPAQHPTPHPSRMTRSVRFPGPAPNPLCTSTPRPRGLNTRSSSTGSDVNMRSSATGSFSSTGARPKDIKGNKSVRFEEPSSQNARVNNYNEENNRREESGFVSQVPSFPRPSIHRPSPMYDDHSESRTSARDETTQDMERLSLNHAEVLRSFIRDNAETMDPYMKRACLRELRQLEEEEEAARRN